jgi:hypothetical protein
MDLSLLEKRCLLDNSKVCNDCGECEICDLDPGKICDNCCRCLGDADYAAIEVEKIIVPENIQLKRKKSKK